jgi:hypothetical protein
MEWMATITGDHVGYPGFQDLGNFSPRRKIFWGAKFARLSASNFAHQNNILCFYLNFSHHFFLNFAVALSNFHARCFR